MTSLIVASLIAQKGPGAIAHLLSPIQVESADFSDLEPLRKAIGAARVVQLGELTHGDGTSFQIKSRIVQFLHQRAGFDVLVWESGLVESDELDERLGGPGSVTDIAATAIFPHWSRSRESIGVFEYALATKKTNRPLQMAGFDIQSSGTRGNSVFLDLAHSIATDKDAKPLLGEIERLRALPESTDRDDAILSLAKPIKALVRRNDPLARKVASYDTYRQMMESFRRYQKVQTGEEFQLGYNLRERENFRNLEWLLNTKFKGKKLIVWAHNAHISHMGADGTYHRPAKGEVVLDSTGRLMKSRFGNQVYSIGFVASGGQWSWLGQPPVKFDPAAEGSLEAILSTAGHDHGFIDLKTGQRTAPGLQDPLPGTMNRQNGPLANLVWPKVFDGLIYIRDMKPRTDLRQR